MRENGKKKKEKKKKGKDVEFFRYTEFEEDEMEHVKLNVEDALPTDDEWTLPILFGSEASAQHFFLIHNFLEAERLMPGTENQVSLYPYTNLDVNLTLIWKEDDNSDASGADNNLRSGPEEEEGEGEGGGGGGEEEEGGEEDWDE